MPRGRRVKPEQETVEAISAPPKSEQANVETPQQDVGDIVNEELEISPELDDTIQEDTKLSLVISQNDDEGRECTRHTISFSLKAEDSTKLDKVIGTAVSAFFRQIELAKATKATYLKGKYPVMLAVKSEQFTIDFGKVEQTILNTLKLNNGERSKLMFIDRLIAITAAVLTPLQTVSLGEIREDAKLAVKLRYPETKSIGIASHSAILSLSKATVNKDGILA